LPAVAPSIDLIEIGAGGGSIARVDRLGLLNVGPESAGAEPGPACYAQGGDQPTVTDADLFLGFLDATRFLGGEMRLDGERARIALSGLARRIGLSTNATAWGIHNLVNENMASAARVHIAEKGMDPRRFTLVATGGAGPVHAAEVAAKLSMRRVLYTVAAGAGSCLGLLAAPARVDRAWSRVQLLADVRIAQLTKAYEQMHADALETLGGTGTSRVRWTLGAEVRYAGQGNAVEISLPFRAINARTLEAVGVAFEERYVALYGHLVPGARPEVVTWRLTGQSRIGSRGFRLAQKSSASDAVATQRRMYLPVRGEYADVPVYERYALPPGTTLEGPLVLQERESTIVLSRPGRVTVLDNLTVSVELA
jgi:N-methylhydantoinase A